MRKWLYACLITAFTLGAAVPVAGANPQAAGVNGQGVHDDRYEMEGCVDKKAFTPAQQQNLDKLFQQQYEDMKKLLNAYEEYGTITKQQKERKLQRFQHRMEVMKKHGYRWCHEVEHEDDHDDHHEHDDHDDHE